MTRRQPVSQHLLRYLLMSVIGAVIASQSAQADETSELGEAVDIKVMVFSKSLKVRGWEVDDGIYMGHAKVAGKYGFGVVVDRKTYSWGINSHGVSISKRF